jgi:hypothetical protein
MTETASSPISTGLSIKGNVHGGQQPVVGAHVYLLAASTTGYGFASNSLLVPTSTGQGDSIGGYVLTASDGSFNITGEYTCSAGTQVYVYALGGNPGAGVNSAAGFLAALGQCPTSNSFSATVPFIYVNEVSTVAAAYALAGYATDATHVSSSANPLALTGIANAISNAANLETISTGVANTTTPGGNGTVPQAMINTIANILASCVNSTGPNSTACITLFANALSNGTTGTTPSDTATAAINIAHNPGANVAALYALATPAAAFSPALTSAPNDYTIGVIFTGGGANGGGISAPLAIAVEGNGNVWITNGGNYPSVLPSISKLSANGQALSPATGYTAGSQGFPISIAIDGNSQAWVSDETTNNLTEYSSSGAPLSPAGGYTGGGLGNGSIPSSVAIFDSSAVWVANLGSTTVPSSVSKFNESGVAQSPTTGYIGGGISKPTSLAVDAAGSIWVANQGTVSGAGQIAKLNSSGTAISPVTGFIGGGLNNPQSIAIDASGNAWVANYSGNTISEFNSSGTALSSSSGFTGGGIQHPYTIVIDGASNVWTSNLANSTVSKFSNSGTALSPATGLGGAYLNGAYGMAADGSGNLWIANSNANSVTQLVGISVPVVAPLSTGAVNGTLGSRP